MGEIKMKNNAEYQDNQIFIINVLNNKSVECKR